LSCCNREPKRHCRRSAFFVEQGVRKTAKNDERRHKGDTHFHFLSLLWPACCPACGRVTQKRCRLCRKCAEENEELDAVCLSCGLPKDNCSCLKNKLDLNLVAVYPYRNGVGKAIRAIKFNGELDKLDFFALKMADRFRAVFPAASIDLVAYVPMTKRGYLKRSYNQSAELAKRIAKQIGSKYGRRVLVKTKETANQHHLSEKQRLKNVKGAFAVRRKSDVSGKTVLLCDDIKTTGATLSECKNELMKAGAKQVYCVTVAVTLKD